jgi:hypothetical protein
MRASTSFASESFTFTSHPSPKGSWFTSSGFFSSFPLRALTDPETGANTCSAAFTDSMTMQAAPAFSSVPAAGTSTKTTSESLFCA